MASFFTNSFRTALLANPDLMSGAGIKIVLFRFAPDLSYTHDYGPYDTVAALEALPGWLEATPPPGGGYPFAYTYTLGTTLVRGEAHYVTFSQYPFAGLTGPVEAKAIGVQMVGGTLNGKLIMVSDTPTGADISLLTAGDSLTANPDTTVGGARWLFNWVTPRPGATQVVLAEGPLAFATDSPTYELPNTHHVWLYPIRANMIANPSFESAAVNTDFWSSNGAIARVAGGAGGSVGEGIPFTFNTTVTAPPTGSQLRLNHADQNLATKLWVTKTDFDGEDVTAKLSPITKDYQLYLQDFDDASKWLNFHVSASRDENSYIEYDVVCIGGTNELPAGKIELQSISTDSSSLWSGQFAGVGDTVIAESNYVPAFKGDEQWTVQLWAKGSGVLRVGLIYWDASYNQNSVDWGRADEFWYLDPASYRHIAVHRQGSQVETVMLRLNMLRVAGDTTPLTIDNVLLEKGFLKDWWYFDGDEKYGAPGDFNWYGGANRRGGTYSFWYNNKKSVLGRLFSLTVDPSTESVTDAEIREQGLVYDWVPAGTTVHAHWDILYPGDITSNLPPKPPGVVADDDIEDPWEDIDVFPPTTPLSLTAGAPTAHTVPLTWTASTDNVGVAGYRVGRCTGTGCTNFVVVGTSIGPSLLDSGLDATTTYRYRVAAFDEAGNTSEFSNIVTVTTTATPGGGVALWDDPGTLWDSALWS